MLYSVYAIYASGKDAVLGGMLVMGIGFVIWGFIAPRFASTQPAAAGEQRPRRRDRADRTVERRQNMQCAAIGKPSRASSSDSRRFAIARSRRRRFAAGARDAGIGRDLGPGPRDRQAHARLSSRRAAVFLSGRAGKPAGYSVALCQKIADQVKTELGLSTLAVEWVPVTLEDRFRAVQQGKVDLLCGADTRDAWRGERTSRSRSRSSRAGSGRCCGRTRPAGCGRSWRKGRRRHGRSGAAPRPQILEKKTFSVVTGTTSESWLAGRLNAFKLTAKVVPVDSYDAGIQRVLDRSSDVFFGDRPILLEPRSAARRHAI